MNLIARRCVTLVCGSSGNGKSEFGERFVRTISASFRAVFIFDPEGEWAHRLRVRPVRTAYEIRQSVTAPRAVVCFDPSVIHRGANEAGLESFAELAFAASSKLRGRKLFVCDEVQTYTAATSIPTALKAIVQQGRRRGLESLFITNEVNQTPGAILSQVTELVAFQQASRPALALLESKGFDPQSIAALPPLHYESRSLIDARRGSGKLTF